LCLQSAIKAQHSTCMSQRMQDAYKHLDAKP